MILEQFIKSIFAHFVKIEPMSAYIQSIPNGVEYPCYLLNKCDINTIPLNAYFYMNTVHLYVRIFGTSEIDIKNKSFKLIQSIFEDYRKIPILERDGTETERFIRIENIESIDIPVDENDVYCVEINFNFDTTHNVSVEEFDLLGQIYSNASFN